MQLAPKSPAARWINYLLFPVLSWSCRCCCEVGRLARELLPFPAVQSAPCRQVPARPGRAFCWLQAAYLCAILRKYLVPFVEAH